ncbi:MAG: siroheme synthase CysG [Hyphomicrobiaceae bacterium]
MRYFPIFLDLAGRTVVVTGGGEKAAQKLRLIAKTQARIIVFASHPNPEIMRFHESGRIDLRRHRPDAADLDDAALVFAADDAPAEAEHVAGLAAARNIPVNAVDAAEISAFIMPAIVDRAPVTVAIGTEGAAPIVARQIKAHLDRWLPARFGHLASAAGRLRDRLKNEIASADLRRRLWERLLTGTFRHRILDGDDLGASAVLDAEIAAMKAGLPAIGSVSLIGCGPGDPDLLTLKAHQRLQEVDVIVVDRLVNPLVLEYARRDARRIEVGKRPGGPSVDQDDINRILVREALKGQRVARLKGGDAFIFGRAAEEMAAVRAAGIPVEIIPGITAAHACAASIELPLTLRGKVRQFSVIAGSSRDEALDLDWRSLAQPGHAFAIYMGVRTAPLIRHRLLAAGAAPATSVVVVENGTLPEERSLHTTLADLPRTLLEHRIAGPAIILVGLDWAEACLTRPAKVETAVGKPACAAEVSERLPEHIGAAG